jgi:uncharacterized protein (DUF885 family)
VSYVRPAAAAIALLALVGGAAAAALARGPGDPAPPAAAAALARILDDQWRHQLDEDLGIRTRLGMPVEKLPDLTLAHAEAEASWSRALIERLDRIDATALAHQDSLTLDLLRDQAEETVEAPRAYWHLFFLTPYDAPFGGVHAAFTSFIFSAPADLDRYLRLLRAYPAMVGQLRQHVEAQAARGIRLPKAEVDVVVAMLRAFALPPRESLFEVQDGRLSGIDPAVAAAFRDRARRIVGDEIDPSLQQLAGELAGEYRQLAPERIGIGQYPGGVDAYRVLVRRQTGFELSPEEIHRRGEEQVERLSQRMAAVRRQLGFAGTAREFHRQLRGDPRFVARTPQEVGERLMAAVRKIEPKIPTWFLRQPRAPYGVERLPAALGGMTFGYYQTPTPTQPRGLYLFNGSDLEQRPLVGAAALIYHELVPGHHFQLALQAENPDLPPFRRYLFHTAFVEGWGEYSSHLGEEMGVYDDPYSLYGRLAMDIFLSNRLVVDTGVNALGWSRQQATDFMRERLLESDAQIDSEVLRYAIALPAQALAYKLGAAHIEDLRHRAETALGSRFDIRRFHDAVLGSGSLPPKILARHIAWWIEQEKRR